jgi:leucyl aminopeptidase
VTWPKIELSAASSGKSDALALAWFQESPGEKKTSPPSLVYEGKRHKEIDALQALLRQSRHFFAKKSEVNMLRYYPLWNDSNVCLLGAGAASKFTAETARQVGAALYLLQKKERLPKVSLQTDSLFSKVSEEKLPYFVQAFCEGYWMAGHEFRDLKKEDPEIFYPQALEFAGLKSEPLTQMVKKANVLAKAVHFARCLGDRPGNVLTPTEFGKLCQKMAKEAGLKCSVWGRSEIEKAKMGLFLGVSKGSEEDPRFIILEHRGGKKGDRPIALVGKGITFDSGGISLKPALRMEEMKYDMMGAATVAGVAQAVAELDLPVNLMCFIATCENMPDGRAQKPGDVARSLSGKTVEIINTDAEGRLILGDALEYAQKFNPEAIIDFATLTGAVVDALGTVTSGIMGNSPALIERIKEKAVETAERVWELPLYEEYEEDLRSHVADIKNSGIREAGSSKGGTFLKFFVDPKFPWVHCDIAGTSWNRRDANYHPQKYGAGVMIRLMTRLIEDWKPLK